MAEKFDVTAMTQRHRERAQAVRNRPLPPVAGREERFDAAIAAIDDINGEDPNFVVIGGVQVPKELAHSDHMVSWVRRLDPDADDLQLIAARAHHLRRWSIPRSSYPEGRSGYLRWRRDLKRQHADEVAQIMTDVGYSATDGQDVAAIVSKRKLSTDRRAQVHEDALCLVFIEQQLGEVSGRLGSARAVEVVAKTLGKMSPTGRAFASELELTPDERAIVDSAAEQVSSG